MAENITLYVPETIEDIELQSYQKYLKISDNLEEGDDAEDFLKMKLLEIFAGARHEDIKNIPSGVVEFSVSQILNCLNEPTPLEKFFTIRGTDGVEITFGFEPELDKMTFGAYVDLDTFIGKWENMHKAMAVMYRPVLSRKGDFYEIERYQGAEKYENIMRYAPVNVALGAMLFFYRLGIKLSRHTLNYTLKSLSPQDTQELEKRFLERNGVGISQFMQSLEGTYSSLIASQMNLSISA